MFDHEGIKREYYKNDFLEWDKQSEISYNNNEIRQKEKYRFYQLVFDYFAANAMGGDALSIGSNGLSQDGVIRSYFEFGCHRVRTFRMALSEARKKMFDWRFFAFDSFEGLPEASGIDVFPGFEAGNLKTSEDEFWKIIGSHNVFVDRVESVKGYFNVSLNNTLAENLKQRKVVASLAYIDCDFYESTKDVLNFIDMFLEEGSVIVFDDWNLYKGSPKKGQRLAFSEFKNSSKWSFEPFLDIGWSGKSFIATQKPSI